MIYNPIATKKGNWPVTYDLAQPKLKQVGPPYPDTRQLYIADIHQEGSGGRPIINYTSLGWAGKQF